jgi:hypothetical protein
MSAHDRHHWRLLAAEVAACVGLAVFICIRLGWI